MTSYKNVDDIWNKEGTRAKTVFVNYTDLGNSKIIIQEGFVSGLILKQIILKYL